MKIAVHLIAGVFDWTESKTSRSRRFLDKAKKDLQEKIKVKTGIRWDYSDETGSSGTTTTGNICRRLLHDSTVRKLVTEEIPITHRDTMEILGQRLSITIH